MSVSEEYFNKIKKDIEDTGFPLEAKVASVFSKLNYDSLYSSYYIDKDENKGREIDFIATKHFSETEDNHGLTYEYVFKTICEIKKANKKPWIFFTTEPNELFSRYELFNFISNDTFSKVIMKKNLVKNSAKSQWLNNRIARSFYEGFTHNSGRDDILKALTGVSKAYYHFKEIDHVNNSKSDDCYLSSYDLLVIVDGDLFESYIDKNEELVLEEKDYIQMSFKYISPSYPELIKRHYSGLMIHVVKVDYLEEFLLNRADKHEEIYNKTKVYWDINPLPPKA